MSTPKAPSARRLTPDERERIVELRLAGVPVRTVAAEVGTTTKTVMATTKRELAERARAFSAKTDATLAKLVSRHLSAADSAAIAAEQALTRGDDAAAVRHMAEERARLQEVAKLSGLYIERIESTSSILTMDLSELSDEDIAKLRGKR